MTEIQQTNNAVANFIIGELHKDKPFNLKLDAGQTGALYHIASESHHLHSGFVRKLEATLRQRVNNGTGVILEINCNADLHYHVLSSYITKHDKVGVVENLSEIAEILNEEKSNFNGDFYSLSMLEAAQEQAND